MPTLATNYNNINLVVISTTFLSNIINYLKNIHRNKLLIK